MPSNNTGSKENKNRKLQTALLSIIVSALLITIKLIFGFLTNSISILASAVDSLLDLSASSVNYFSIKKAEKPADKEHRFGHGKAEGLAGLFQSSFIGLSSLYLVYESIKRLITGATIQSIDSAIVVMAFTTVVSFLFARYLERVAKETDSIALGADCLHYKTDVYTNLSVIIGLIAIKLLGFIFIDSLISIGIAVYIIWSTVGVLKGSIDILMDRELPKEIVEEIKGIILSHKPLVKSYHKMRTRRSGSKRFIEFHLVMDHTLSFVESHNLAEDIIKDIENKVPNADVTVHVDPHSFPDHS